MKKKLEPMKGEQLRKNQMKTSVLSYNLYYERYKEEPLTVWKCVQLLRMYPDRAEVVSEDYNIPDQELINTITFIGDVNKCLHERKRGYYYTLIF